MQSSDHVDAPGRAPDEPDVTVEPDTTPSGARATTKSYAPHVWLWLGAVAVGVVHFWLADGARGPAIFADEIGYIANARYLAGGGIIDMSNTAFYSGGWSLAIAPLSRLFADKPGTFYASIIATQSVLAVFSVVLIARLCKWLFETSWGIATLAACTGGLYTAYVSNSGFAWSESALTFTLLVVLTAAVWLVKGVADADCPPRTLIIRAVLTGIACGYLVTVHRRTLAAALGLLAVLTVYLVLNHKPRVVAAAIIPFGVAMLAGRVLDHRLNQALWHGTGGVDVSTRVSSLLSVHGAKGTIVTAAGQTWYQLVATGGLVGIGVIALVLLAANRNGPNAERRVAATMIFVVFGLILALSVAFLANGLRADHVVYGRYVDIATPLLVAVGIAWLGTRPAARALGIAAVSLMVVLFGAWLVLEAASGRLDRQYNRVTTLGTLGWLDYRNGSPAIVRATLWTTLIALGVIAIAYVTRSSQSRAWIGLGAICVIVVSLFAWQLTFVRQQVLNSLAKESNSTQSIVQAVRRTGVSEVALTPSVSVIDRLGLEFWLPGFKVVTANPQIESCASVVSLSRKPPTATSVQPLPTTGGMYLFRGQKAC